MLENFEPISYMMGLTKGGQAPSGTITITENGTHDVSAYASASVNVPQATEPFVEETLDSSGKLTDAVLKGYTRVRYGAFRNCDELLSVSIPTTVTRFDTYAFYGCSKLVLTELPNIIIIGASSFGNCAHIEIDHIPNSVRTIGNGGFSGCTGLTSLTFDGTPAEIGTTAFNGCTNLTQINVPWSEGAVAGAPWGATNATITYDYTGE